MQCWILFLSAASSWPRLSDPSLDQPGLLIHGQACLNRRKRWRKQRWINTNSCVKHISSGGGIWYTTATRRRKRKTKIPNKFIHSLLASKARTASRRARRIVKNKRGGG